LLVHMISNHAHSTTLTPLRCTNLKSFNRWPFDEPVITHLRAY